jgi:hypothetical protein
MTWGSLVMESFGYVVLRDEETGEIEKIGRFREDGITESFRNGKWLRDHILYSELLDGLLEKISEAEAKRLITLQHRREKIAA